MMQSYLIPEPGSSSCGELCSSASFSRHSDGHPSTEMRPSRSRLSLHTLESSIGLQRLAALRPSCLHSFESTVTCLFYNLHGDGFNREQVAWLCVLHSQRATTQRGFDGSESTNKSHLSDCAGTIIRSCHSKPSLLINTLPFERRIGQRLTYSTNVFRLTEEQRWLHSATKPGQKAILPKQASKHFAQSDVRRVKELEFRYVYWRKPNRS